MSTKQADLRVGKLDCESDAAAIERELKGTPGLVGLKVYPKSAKVALTYEPVSVSPGAPERSEVQHAVALPAVGRPGRQEAFG